LIPVANASTGDV